MRYIRKRENGSYELRKWKKGKLISFGVYPNLNDARKARAYFQKNAWDVGERHLFGIKPKYYSHKGNGYYQISKQINGKQIYFDYVNGLENVKREVELLEKCGWDLDALCEGIDETVDEGVIFLNKKMGEE